MWGLRGRGRALLNPQKGQLFHDGRNGHGTMHFDLCTLVTTFAGGGATPTRQGPLLVPGLTTIFKSEYTQIRAFCRLILRKSSSCLRADHGADATCAYGIFLKFLLRESLIAYLCKG